MSGITLYPASILRCPASPVTPQELKQEIPDLIEQMLDLMYQADGVGLAGPQAGVPKQIFVADIGQGPVVLLNPSVIESSEEEENGEEGCLSLPKIRVHVTRPKWIRVRGMTPQGEEIVYNAEVLLARVFQHEMDHLKGILIIDRASVAEKMLLKSKLKALKRE